MTDDRHSEFKRRTARRQKLVAVGVFIWLTAVVAVSYWFSTQGGR